MTTTTTERRGRGRPPKPPGEKFRPTVLKLPPRLFEELTAIVPDRQRASWIRKQVERGLRAERRRLAKEVGETPSGGE